MDNEDLTKKQISEDSRTSNNVNYTVIAVGVVIAFMSYLYGLWCLQHRKTNLIPMEAARNADTSNFDNLLRF